MARFLPPSQFRFFFFRRPFSQQFKFSNKQQDVVREQQQTSSSSSSSSRLAASAVSANAAVGVPEFCDARLLFAADQKFASVELIQRDSEAAPLRLPLVWLRDHCRHASSYNRETNQRRADCTELFKRAELAEDCYPIRFEPDAQQLRLQWADGAESCFAVRELLDWALHSKKVLKHGEECLDEWEASECPSRTLWTPETLKEVPTVSSKNFDFSLFARLFIRFGVVSVSGVDSRDEQATRELCQLVAPIHATFFGDFWTFGNSQQQSMASFDDTAYGQEGIGPHTDGTYLDQSPGIQVFHCLKQARQGGLTLLVDGFAAAEQLRSERPDLFTVLAETAIEHHYLDERSRLHARSFREPVIRQFPRADKIAQLRFNPYDRAPMRTLRIRDVMDGAKEERALEETVLFYEAYQHLARLISAESRQLRLRLRPGSVLFLDNFRVLHGRQAYEGERTMCGCYLSRDCFLAKARPILSPNLYKNV